MLKQEKLDKNKTMKEETCKEKKQENNKENQRIKEYLSIAIIVLIFLLLCVTQNLKCIFNTLTGLYCSGCGITRMGIAILKLDFYQAFRYNPLIFLLIILSALYVAYSLIKYKKIVKLNNKLFVLLVIIVLLFGVLRNIPYFNFLAPTEVFL